MISNTFITRRSKLLDVYSE